MKGFLALSIVVVGFMVALYASGELDELIHDCERISCACSTLIAVFDGIRG